MKNAARQAGPGAAVFCLALTSSLHAGDPESRLLPAAPRPIPVEAMALQAIDPAAAAGLDKPTLSIELHPDYCEVRGLVSDAKNARNLADTVANAFPRRCFSNRLNVAVPAGSTTAEPARHHLPIDLAHLPDLLYEMAGSGRSMRLDWFAHSRRLAIHGQSFSDVTLAAIELRLRMASTTASDKESENGSTHADFVIQNHITLVDAPHSKTTRREALATLIERDFAGSELPFLPPLQFEPIYFMRRDSKVNSQERPKLIDAIDQLSTCRIGEEWPMVIVTAYALPRGDEMLEIAAGLQRASAVRDHLISLGIPADRFTVETIRDESSTRLTWRSRRVEISVAPKAAERRRGLASTQMLP